MKASKFSKAQIAFVLKQAEDGMPIGEVCRKAGILTRRFTIGAKNTGLDALGDEAAATTA